MGDPRNASRPHPYANHRHRQATRRVITLQALGPMYNVFTQLHRALSGPGRPQAQRTMAERIGITQQTVSRIENGQTEPRLSNEQIRSLVRFYFEATRLGNFLGAS